MPSLATYLRPLVLVLGGVGAIGQASAQKAEHPAVAQAPITPPVIVQRTPTNFADVASRLIDAVVNISTSQTVEGGRSVPMPQVPPGSPFEDFFEEFFNRGQRGEGGQGQQQQPSRRVSSLGSGFIIDPSGLVVTNNHVIQDADEVVVNLNDGTKLNAEILGRDSKTDLALLKVKSDKPLPAVPFGASDSMRIGDWVMAIGNPFGLGGSLTVGVISAINRDIQSGPYDNFIQTDASINRGNSGGPLFNMNGEVIGINTAIISPSGGSIGIGFAVPSSTATAVISQLREFGETRRGWLGVRIQSVTEEIAESLGLGRARGAMVAGLTDKGPAEQAGIQPGDVILEFDGKPVPSIRELPRMVADTPIGKQVPVKVLRRGQEEMLTATVGRLEEGEAKQSATRTPEKEPDRSDRAPSEKILGLSLSRLSADLRREYGLGEEVNGVVVTAVDPDTSSPERRLNPGDVIVEVAYEKVQTPADVQRKVEALKREGKRQALLMITTAQNEQRFVALPIQ